MAAPAPADSLGNPTPRYSATVDLPAAPTPREGRVVSAGDRLPVDLSACRKILVVRLDFIGDWVLTLPFLAGLRQSAPQAEITAVVLTRVHDLARSCRSVDRVIAVEPRMTGPMEFLGSDENDLAGFVASFDRHMIEHATG